MEYFATNFTKNLVFIREFVADFFPSALIFTLQSAAQLVNHHLNIGF